MGLNLLAPSARRTALLDDTTAIATGVTGTTVHADGGTVAAGDWSAPRTAAGPTGPVVCSCSDRPAGSRQVMLRTTSERCPRRRTPLVAGPPTGESTWNAEGRCRAKPIRPSVPPGNARRAAAAAALLGVELDRGAVIGPGTRGPAPRRSSPVRTGRCASNLGCGARRSAPGRPDPRRARRLPSRLGHRRLAAGGLEDDRAVAARAFPALEGLAARSGQARPRWRSRTGG